MSGPPDAPAGGASLFWDEYAIHCETGRIDDRTRVLKHGDTFAVFDRFGDIELAGHGGAGLFHDDTRFLSLLTLRIGAARPLLLSSAVKADNALLAVDLTNPDVRRRGASLLGQGTIHVFRSKLLWNATCHERLRIHNYGRRPVRFPVELAFAADFADIFEVRGVERSARGRREPAETGAAEVVFRYHGLDGRVRHTRIRFDPAPLALDETTARFDVALESQGAATLHWAVECGIEEGEAGPVKIGAVAPAETVGTEPYDAASQAAVAALFAARDEEPSLETSNEQFDDWLARSLADLHMLRTQTPHGPYPYAGVPWFNTAFGRDGLVTAFECLWFAPQVARGVLGYLAATQADTDDPAQDAQPGRILHETRAGEMAALGEVPFRRYYGSTDATPLFVMLAGAYYERTGDLETVAALWPAIERALEWIDRDGDADGDGFVEYARRAEQGLVHQGWKDSDSAVFHADGRLAAGPIALCEVQAYVYGARRAAAGIAAARGDIDRARLLETEAEALRVRFDQAFWCEDLATYAIALDGDKQPCRVRTSNAGHCLFAGIAPPERARRVAGTLLSEPFHSGWGVRTVASTEIGYNPMSYHNGSVWPHDTALCAGGFGRYGLREAAVRITAGLFDAAIGVDLHRLPELICGFTRRPDETPTLYPTACAPQAWAAAAPLLCLQACLGLEIDGPAARVVVHEPLLPAFLDHVAIRGLTVGAARLDLLFTRHEADVGVRLLDREGDAELVVVK